MPVNEAIAKIVAHLRRVRPQVVITFGPEGGYGHPDHIAISQLTTAAIVCAADASYANAQTLASHRVSKLYYMAWSQAKWTAFQAALYVAELAVPGHAALFGDRVKLVQRFLPVFA
jgi:LmbE family N-acetylglucosaminyl deacetylase